MEYIITGILILLCTYALKNIVAKILTILYIIGAHLYHIYSYNEYIIIFAYASAIYITIILYLYFFKDYHKFKNERVKIAKHQNLIKKVKTDKLLNDVYILNIARERFRIKNIILQKTLDAYIQYKDKVISSSNNVEFLKSSLDIVKFKNKIYKIKKDLKSLNLYLENIDYVLNQSYQIIGKKENEIPNEYNYNSNLDIDSGINDIQIELMQTKDLLINAINKNSAFNKIIKKNTNDAKAINIYKFVNIDESNIDINKYIIEYEKTID